MNADGRQLLQQIQEALGTYLEGEVPLLDDSPAGDDQPDNDDDSEHTASEETETVMHAVRNMCLSLYVF